MSERWERQTPKRFLGAEPDMIDATMSKPWLAHKGNVIVYGPRGTGKTFACHAMLKAKDDSLRSWLMLSVDEALDFWRPGNEDGRHVRPDRCGLLVLDDVGVGKLSEWGAGVLDNLVNTRWRDMLPTWITTNLDLSEGGELCREVGERTWSRLLDNAYIVAMGGKDRRLA